MTDPTEQELAKYWLDKIPEIAGGWVRTINHTARVMFHSDMSSPLIAHLIQNFMEGEGYIWSLKKGNGYTADYELRENIKDAWKHHAVANNENKWLANALAAWRAKEEK